MTDGSGSFQAQFIVDGMTLKSAYHAVADPVITSDIKLAAFDTQFAVQ